MEISAFSSTASKISAPAASMRGMPASTMMLGPRFG
jgi:hypothetical protein